MNRNLFFKQKNCFRYPTYSPISVFLPENEKLRDILWHYSKEYLFKSNNSYFDIIKSASENGIQKVLDGEQIEVVERELEEHLHFSYKEDSFINSTLQERCERVADQVIDALKIYGVSSMQGKSILDVGAGTGLIAKECQKKLQATSVLLTDVVDYRDDVIKDMDHFEFSLFKQPFDKIDTTKKYDLCLITNVLHHCDNPFKVFRTALSTLNKSAYIVVIESCINITASAIGHGFEDAQKIRYQNVYNTDSTLTEITSTFLKLPDKDMMLFGSFFDWLYNRVFLNESINVPYNFGKPEDWDIFFKSCGLTKLNTFLLGFDQPAALEFHTLHILKKGHA